MGSGAFCVGEYFDEVILFPQARGQIYEAKGLFSTVPEFHSTLLSLNEKLRDDGAYLRFIQQSSDTAQSFSTAVLKGSLRT